MTPEQRQAYLEMDARILVRVIRCDDELSEGQATRILRDRENNARAAGAAQMTLERVLRDDDDASGQTVRVWRIIVSGAHVTLRGANDSEARFLLIRKEDVPTLIEDLKKAAAFDTSPAKTNEANDG